MADQSNVLLMAALQPVCDRLRWDLPEPKRKDQIIGECWRATIFPIPP